LAVQARSAIAFGARRFLEVVHGGPVKSILDPTFCYIPSMYTDISKTFARIRCEQRNGAQIAAEPAGAPPEEGLSSPADGPRTNAEPRPG